MEDNAIIHVKKKNHSLQVTMLLKKVTFCCSTGGDKGRRVIHEQLPKVTWLSSPLMERLGIHQICPGKYLCIIKA